MIGEFVLDTILGEIVGGFLQLTGYVLVRSLSFGLLKPSNELIAVLVGLLFWILVGAGLYFAFVG